MEVSLLDVQGLPPGCIISVRSGTTRCQAPADPEKLRLCFPKGVKDPFKVDLLAPLGSAVINYQPGANAYPIQVPVNGAIGSITLAVREMEKPKQVDLNAISSMEYTKDEKGRPATPATASRRHRLALQARTYLDDHQLLMFVQSLLQGLIKDRPTDPWEYINEASLTAKKVGVSEPYKPGSTPRDLSQDPGFDPPVRSPGRAIPVFLTYSNPAGVVWAEYIAPSCPEMNAEGKLTGPWLEVMRAAVAFEHETPAWSAQDDFIECTTGPAGMVLDYLESCGYGEFAPALVAAEGETQAQYEAVGDAGVKVADPYEATPVQTRPTSAQPTLISNPMPDDELALETIQGALSTLEQALSDTPSCRKPSVGSWLGQLPKVWPEAPEPEAPPEPTAEELEELRTQLKTKLFDSLLQTSSNGRLHSILAQMEEAERLAAQQETKQNVLAGLQQAQVDGTLNNLASQMRQMEGLRQSTAARLIQAAGDGNFGQNLQEQAEAPELEMADLQSSVRNLFLNASENGSLEDILGKQDTSAPQARPMTPELATLRCEMRKLLVKAAGDGTFEKALEELQQPSTKATASLPWYPLPWKEQPVAPEFLEKVGEQIMASSQDNVVLEVDDVLRAQARSLLLQATMNGGLDKTLETNKKAAEDEELQGLRKMARSVLLQASEEGTLSQALQEVSSAQPVEEAVLAEASEEGTLSQALQEVSTAQPAEEPVLDEAAQLRKKAMEMLAMAQGDASFFAALQEAASAQGFEFELRPKQSAPSSPSAPAASSSQDMWELRSKASKQLVEAALDGRFLQALAESAEASQEPTQEVDEDHDHRTGDEVIDRSRSRRYTVLKRTKTEVLLKAIDGDEAETWKPAMAVDKVPKLNLARAIDIAQEDLYAAAAPANELFAPVHQARPGDQVQRAGNPRSRGSILQRTTTDVLMRMDDGSETWCEAEGLEQVLVAALDAQEGQEVVVAGGGIRGTAKQRTTTDILILNDDGSEEWHEIENVGRPKTNPELFQQVDLNNDGQISAAELDTAAATVAEVELAKDKAREALMAAFAVEDEDDKQLARDALMAALGDGDDELVDLAKENAREALMSAFRAGTPEDVERAKENARDALMSAFLGGDSTEEIDRAKDVARDALMSALLVDDSEAQEVDLAKEAARDALMSALLTGGGSTEDAVRPSTEELRNKAKKTLLDATYSGKLDQALGDIKKSQAEVIDTEQLRQQAKQTLLDATSSGKLDQALAEIQKPQDAVVDTEQLRKQAKQTLLDATSSGKLDRALAEIKKPQDPTPETEQLREQEPPQSPPPESQKEGEAAEAPDAVEVTLVGDGDQVLGDMQQAEQPPASSTAPAGNSSAKQADGYNPASPALSAASFGELEEKIRVRNERFRTENDALRRENRRLKALWDKKLDVDKKDAPRQTGPDAS